MYGCLFWVPAALSILVLGAMPGAAGADGFVETLIVPCATSIAVGIDTSLATSSADDILGEAVGQTFVARDTLVRSLTVWRVASQCSSFDVGIDPYITETDSMGKPLTGRILLHGPTLVIRDGDCVHPIKFHWVFDPPVALPRPGTYAFFLQVPSYQCPSYFDVLARDLPDKYPDGHFWLTGRSLFTNCMLAYAVTSFPDGDLVFTIEFCHESETQVSRRSWGRLKATYR